MNLHHCQTCGKVLTARQIQRKRRCCSNRCRIDGKVNCAELNHDALKEPYTDAEVAACDAQVAEGKRQEAREHIALLAMWTPLDDSPEAERRLRARLGSEEELVEV